MSECLLVGDCRRSVIVVENALKYKDNSIWQIKVFAAYTVAIGHFCNVLQGVTTPVWEYLFRTIWQGTAIVSGVVIFFALSGYLMWISYEKNPTPIPFYKKRILRIYPPLWLCSAVALIIILLINRSIEIKGIIQYIVLQGLGVSYTPEFLKNTATGSINGALWTITVQIQFYFLVPVLYLLEKKIKRKSLFWSVLIGGALLTNVWTDVYKNYAPPILSNLLTRTCLPTFLWFAVGLFIGKYRNRIVPILRKYVYILLGIYLIYRALAKVSIGFYADIVTGILMPLIAIGLAYRCKKSGCIQDFSYELFLIHWPILNIIIGCQLYRNLNAGVLFIGFILSITLISCLLHKIFGTIKEKHTTS